MKKILSVTVLMTLVSMSSFAQLPGQEMLPPSPQNTIHFVYGASTNYVERIAYDAYEEANAAAGDAGVVFIGDSITQNWYAFHRTFFDRNGFLARGISGQTSIEILCRFRQDVVKHNPKVVVMMIGTNDVAQNVGAISDECYLDNVASACDIAKANGIKMLLCSIPPCDFFPWSPELTPVTDIVRLNGKLQAYAAENGIQYVDFFSILNNGRNGMIEEYTSDHCHPTPAGYNIMERFVVNEINKALGTDTDYFVTKD